MAFRRLLPVAGLIAALCFSTPVKPQAQDLTSYLGPLAGVVELGDDGLWDARVQDGWFTLSNENDPGAVTFYWVETTETLSGRYGVDLNLVVRGQGSDTSYAGMLFNYRANNEYLGVVLGSDGATYAIVRNPNGFNIQPISGEGAAPRGDGSDVLRVTVNDGEAQFTLNGAILVSISNEQAFSSQIGIIAAGAGLFGFTDFSISAGG